MFDLLDQTVAGDYFPVKFHMPVISLQMGQECYMLF
jgi:hypothetical protein